MLDCIDAARGEIAALADLASDAATDCLDVASLLVDIEQRCSELEAQCRRADDHDMCDALLRISAGAGGIEAQAWARMLVDMYAKWCRRNGRRAELVAMSPRHSSDRCTAAELKVSGARAYGQLRAEHGVHRMSRMSPYGSADKRQTSFAHVEVVPLLPAADEDAELDDIDLRIDTFRSSGPGGQHRNKADTAVRIVHEPTGLRATCDATRSQARNKAMAKEALRSRLAHRQRQQQAAKIADLVGQRAAAQFGSQIRSYVLFPNQLVVDHRTGYKAPNAQEVLDGDLTELHRAWHTWHLRREARTASATADPSGHPRM